MQTIFVQISSYRDPECQWTVKDLFDKATHPERIHVGICWQYDPEHDTECFKNAERAEQVRISPFHWQESEGIAWARHQAQQLWNGEDYILSIDLPMRFNQGWDEQLIGQWKECGNPKAVLSNYPMPYTEADKLDSRICPTVARAHLYTPQGDLRIYGAALARPSEHPLKGAFATNSFLFAPSDFISKVPFDPYLYVDQEDISLSARLFTHGFDVYSLKNVLLHHYYMSERKKNDKSRPPAHWEDNPGWLRIQERARKRVNHLLKYSESSNPLITMDIEKYGLGSVRSLEDYQAYCGVDFKHRRVSERALRCGFIENLSQHLDAPIHIPEIDNVKQAPALALAVTQQPATATLAFDQPLAIERLRKSEPGGRKLNIDKEAPEGVMIVYDYLDKKTCKMLKAYADKQAFTDLDVADPVNSTADKIVTMRDPGRVTHHVDIDGKALDILNIFTDIFCNRIAEFYNVNFEWYERPQILRYPPGGKYDQHADSENWQAVTDTWARAQDRDYSVLLYLNNEFEGGELELVNQKFRIKPKPGMLLAFPSDHRYLHAALPTTSGLRYAIVSWAAIVGTQRVRGMPFGSVYVRQKRPV